MVRPKVFVTRKIPDAGLKLLKKHCKVKIYSKDRVIPEKELIKGVKWCDALLCLLTDKINKKVIDANPDLKIISNYAVGYNNVDIVHASKKGVPVSNTPGLFISDAVAEHTFALILAITKRIVESDAFIRAGKYKGWAPELLLGAELKGKTLGIIGLGRIGSAVAERASHGMGANVIYYDIKRNLSFEKKYKAKKTSLHNLLKKADVITIHVPLLKSTHHLIGRKEISMMKKTAYLINTSRGPVIDEKALTSALQHKKIAGAALDVYEKEPLLTRGLKKLKNVVLTPHTASATLEARQAMSSLAAENILLVLKGKKPKTLVNKDYKKK